MLKETYYNKGKNDFKNNIFCGCEWSAPTMVSYEEIKRAVSQFHFEGRKIKRFRTIGLSYSLTRDCIESTVYNQFPDLDEEEKQHRSNYDNIDPFIKLPRSSFIDEPLLIEFEDGDRFEINTPQQPEFRMSMNSIPWWINAGTNLPNVDADILFSPCIGQTIIDVDINTYITDKDPMLYDTFEDGREYKLVSNIVLRLKNEIGLSIGGWVDYCEVNCIDKNDNIIEISFKELKSGLFNWEDLHIDSTVGYESESNSFFFGDKAAEHTDKPYITLVPGKRNTSLNISADDFILFDWSITDLEKEYFDEYGSYEYDREQWANVLDEAERLINFETFDELFDYRISLDIKNRNGDSIPLRQLNYDGVTFWKNKERLKTQLNDMEAWTSLVLGDSDIMFVYGF